MGVWVMPQALEFQEAPRPTAAQKSVDQGLSSTQCWTDALVRLSILH